MSLDELIKRDNHLMGAAEKSFELYESQVMLQIKIAKARYEVEQLRIETEARQERIDPPTQGELYQAQSDSNRKPQSGYRVQASYGYAAVCVQHVSPLLSRIHY